MSQHDRPIKDLPMTTCPICSCQLENGYLQSARQIFFSQKKHMISFLPDSEAVLLTEDMLSTSGNAFMCPRCKIVIVPFRE